MGETVSGSTRAVLGSELGYRETSSARNLSKNGQLFWSFSETNHDRSSAQESQNGSREAFNGLVERHDEGQGDVGQVRGGGHGVGKRSDGRESLVDVAEEEVDEESKEEKVVERMCFDEEDVNWEEKLLLTVGTSVLPVHCHLVLLRARLDACRTTLELHRELAGTFRRLA